MLLVIDVGNTNISIGIYDKNSLQLVSRIATDREKTCDQYAVELIQIFKLHGITKFEFEGSAVSTVVPELKETIVYACEMITSKHPVLLSPMTKTGIKIDTENPSQVGVDLVAASVAAVNKYPLPCLIVDLGTATKISYVDKNKTFRGCAIAPGVRISLAALAQRTSQLPAIGFDSPGQAVGRNTVESMQSGIVYGTASMIDGLCARIEKEMGCSAKTVVATGGIAENIIKSCEREMIYNGELIIEGLKIIYELNR